MGHWIYDYDANGNLTYQKDAKLQEIRFQYDALNRVTLKDYPVGTDVVYTYDETFSTNPKGRLTTVTDSSGTTKFYYDKLGQTTKTIKTIDSVNYTTETTYDALGRTDTIKYPDNTIIKYEYDTGSNLLRVKNNTTGIIYATYSNYNALGQVGDIAFLNGVTTHYDYYTTTNNRLMRITTKKGTQPSYIELTYNYDNVGNIKNITDYVDPSKTRNFVYDDLNRLIQAGSTSYGGNLIYQYDKIGNMTYNCKYGYYYYDDPLHKHAVTKIRKTDGTIVDQYSYDADGNMTGGAGRTFTYDYDNRPTSITYGSTYANSVYDASGNRVKKVTPTSTTVYIGDLYECTSGQCTKYIFAGMQRVAKIDSAGTYYYHTDHLGSSNIITNSSGSKVEDLFYYPYGERLTDSGSVNVRHKFTGQEYDAETGLYYYGARYYDPKLARFISADTIVPDFADPQTLNRYSYCANNPVIYTDPSGHFFLIDDIIVAVASYVAAHAAVIAEGAVIGAAINGTIAAATGGNIGQAMLTGAITGGIFAGVGSIPGMGSGEGAFSSITQAGIHAGAGAVSGGINAAITGGNIGMGMLTGGISGGIANYAGGYLPKGFGYQLAGRSLIGGITGGITAELYGGKFGQGFEMGAKTGAFGYLCNHMLHQAGRLIYHRHGNNPPSWGNNNNERGRVEMELPPDGSSEAFNQAMTTAASTYLDVVPFAAGAAIAVTGNPKSGYWAYDVLSNIIKTLKGEPASIPGIPIDIINPSGAE